MYNGSKRAEIKPMRYQPTVSNGVANMTVNAAAITQKPSVACHDQTAHRPVHTGSHHRAA